MHGNIMETRKARIHDRRATELPYNAEVAEAIVDDPNPSLKGDKERVTRSLRDDPLARMHCRSQIDDAQFAAGRRFLADWEAVEQSAQAIDLTRPKVDGGRFMDPLNDARQRAAKRLNNVLQELGTDGMKIVEDFLISRMTVSQLARRRGWSGQSWDLYFGRRLRECLDRMAVVYGCAMRT